MTPRPPRFALAILNRVAQNNEALAGDILEAYRSNQSRLWFWKQLLAAILTGAFRSTGEIRPLKLVEFPSWESPREDYAAQRAQLQLLLSASGVRGVGGWTVIAAVVLISFLEPLLWGLLAFGILSGVAIGLIRVAIGRRRGGTALPRHLLLR